MTCASMPRALSQRASQKPSRPASKATAMRLILCPACSASSRHRCSNFSNALSSTASFFNGERSTPGTIPAISQLDWPISITAISVASCSRIARDLLKSFSCGMGRSVDSLERRWWHCPRRSPHSIFFGAFHALAVDDGGVGPADIQDRDGGILLLATLFGMYPFLKKLFADGAYRGPQFQKPLAKMLPYLPT